MLVLLTALVVVNAWIVVLVSVTLDGLVIFVTIQCVQIIAPPMGSVIKPLQYVIVCQASQVGDIGASSTS